MRRRDFWARDHAAGARPRRRRGVGLAVAAASSLVLLGGGLAAADDLLSNGNLWPYAPTTSPSPLLGLLGAPGRSPVLATVGDISCQPGAPVEAEKQSDVCDATGLGSTTRMAAQTATANQIEAMQPDLVAILGDEQYQVGRYEDFMGSFNTTYGAFKFLQRPAPGNHEFYDNHGQTGVHGDGYFDYYNGFQLDPLTGNPITDTFTDKFGPSANVATFTQPRPRQDGQAGHVGNTGNGWYSYNLGSWHIISLNAECAVQPGGCDPSGSWFAGETHWLAQDLARDRASCTLAYWHQPTFSVANAAPGVEGQAADAWWQLLYRHGGAVVLNGHDHTYARYAPMDPTGRSDPRRGIREFIVGTGGESLDPVLPNAQTPNLQAATGDYYGAMALTLNPNGYTWDYASALKSPTAAASLPATYRDTGSARCR